MMPLSMRATRVSAMSQEITRIFLAMLGRAFPPEGAIHCRLRTKKGTVERAVPGCVVGPTIIPQCHARAGTNQLPCLGRRRGTPALFARAALATEINRPAPERAADGRTFGDGAGPGRSRRASLAIRLPETRPAGQREVYFAQRKAPPHASTLPLLPSGPGGFHVSTSAGPHAPFSAALQGLSNAWPPPRRAKKSP